jgi:hypothetical protein
MYSTKYLLSTTKEIKGKFALVPHHHDMKTYGEHEDDLQTVSTARRRSAVSFMPKLLYPGERAPDTLTTVGLVDPRASLAMVVAKRKIRLLSAIKPWSYSLYHHFTN